MSVFIYSVDEYSYLTMVKINNQHPNNISLIKNNGHFDLIITEKQQEIVNLCQALVYDVIILFYF